VLPTGTLVSETQKCAPKYKSSKEGFMVICCGNAFRNQKLKLVAIVKAKNNMIVQGHQSRLHFCLLLQTERSMGAYFGNGLP
jgi:hypothetical protein